MATKTPAEIDDWVEIYAAASYLHKPEKIILEKLKNKLPTMKMLDIGIGGGRTTCHFAKLAGQYVGIDFDEGMIEACKKRFQTNGDKISFLVCNAKSMTMFEDESFDFVVFSFNGIDYLSHEDRLQALKEMNRVAKKTGYFLFSTHNLNSVDRLVSLPRFRVRRPEKFAKALYRHFLLKILNGNIEALKSERYARINDGVYCHKLSWLIRGFLRGLGYFYYSKPEEQIKQLNDHGFKILNIYAVDGKEITDRHQLHSIKDYWLHYFCQIEKDNPLRATSLKN